MSDAINTDQYVRARPGIKVVHVLGILSAFGVVALVALVLAGRGAPTPTMLVLVALLYGGLWMRQRRHQAEVIAAILVTHGVQVPNMALSGLLHGRETVFDHDGGRYRVGSTGEPTWSTRGNEPAKVVLTQV